MNQKINNEGDDKKKKVYHLHRKIQDALKQDNFNEALMHFEMICNIKKPEWNEISFIWCYALVKLDKDGLFTILEKISKNKKTFN